MFAKECSILAGLIYERRPDLFLNMREALGWITCCYECSYCYKNASLQTTICVKQGGLTNLFNKACREFKLG